MSNYVTEPELITCEGGDKLFNSESLRLLALEILKSKLDLKATNTEEIFKAYYDIWMKLRTCNQELKSDAAHNYLNK